MSYVLLEGKPVADHIKEKIKNEIATLVDHRPRLAVVVVGENPASEIYVRNKQKACEDVGIESLVEELPSYSPTSAVQYIVEELSNDYSVHGILVQLPLPDAVDESVILNSISPEKDVDGFHPTNVGNLMIGDDTIFPCTALGVIEMLKYYNIPIAGKHCVVVGRSNIVGKPLAMMLLREDATVTICHSKTEDLSSITKQADILISAVGKERFITSDMVKDCAVVIDVGINRTSDGKVVGDVDFVNVADKCSAITPVPGGVGVMTVAMLLQNTLKCYKNQLPIL